MHNKELPEGVNFYFGTDNLGRDLFSRVLYGTQTSLIIAFAAALFDITIGVTYGIISGWFGGRVDTVMQRFLEINFSNSKLNYSCFNVISDETRSRFNYRCNWIYELGNNGSCCPCANITNIKS